MRKELSLAEELLFGLGCLFGGTFGLIVGIFGTVTAVAYAGLAAGVAPFLIGSGLLIFAYWCFKKYVNE